MKQQLPPNIPCKPPPPTTPYDEFYYEPKTPSKYHYDPYQIYEEINHPIEETYPKYEKYHGYSYNQLMDKVKKEYDELYKRMK